ncbi:probable ubiquitin carboxyl-terminal hydrolase 13 at N-terminal half [Coccomyxa sp. Obi]|nr:probable ubiquitin carboxyl-terminal hydrolase 13 at N-terminal half [Coccomyxa sp. Obi]
MDVSRFLQVHPSKKASKPFTSWDCALLKYTQRCRPCRQRAVVRASGTRKNACATGVSTMAKKKVTVTQPVDGKDRATTFWFCMAAFVPILAMGLRMFTAIPYKPPPTKTDMYSGYRWARCDSNRKLCNREYNGTTTAKVPQYAARRADSTQDTQHAGVPIVLYSKDPHEHFSDKRAVGSKWVYSRVARELDDLRSEGIDPVRLEDLLVSLAQTSSGNVGESIALKRPDVEERYWEQLKAFVHKYPEPETGDVQELFKGWYKQDLEVYPPAATMPTLPAFGDFKWQIEQHSTLTAERYMSSVFYAGGYPWRMVYYPKAVYSPGHVSIFLTPAASQLNLPNWSRRVSFHIRIFGHDKPAMSIWANMSNCIFTADKRDDEVGFSQFTTRELLATRGRGYLKNDVLEIRTIVRVDAVSNMAPPPPTQDTSTGDTDMMSATLQRFLRVPLAAWSVILGGTASNSVPCKWCSWQGGPSLGHPLPFGLKLILAPDHSSISLGHVYGDSTWLQAALNAVLDILVPCCLAILLCHAAALPLFICNMTVGPLCGKRWYEMLCYLKDARSIVTTVLVMEGCLGRLLLTSLLLQQLLSRAGLLGLLVSQLFTLCLRCLQAHDLDHVRTCETASPRSSSSSSSSGGKSTQSAEAPPPSPRPALWWQLFGMTLLAESLTNFGPLWNLVAPLGIGLALLHRTLTPTDIVYLQMLPATLVDCLRHSGSVPSRVMSGPLVLVLKGLAASVKGRKVWYAALLPTEESLHATVCSALAFVCLASVLVPELRRDWKLAAPVLALAASGPGVGLALAGVCAWESASELPPEETAWQWLRKRLTALPRSIVIGAGCTVWRCLCGPLFLCRTLTVCKPALKVAPNCDKKPSMADGKAAKRCASSSPQRLKQKHSGHGRAAGSKANKPKQPKDAKAAAAPPIQGKAKLSQRACDATATITISSKSSASQNSKPAMRARDKHASPDRPPLLPLTSEPNVIPNVAATDNAIPVMQQTGKPPAVCATPAAITGQSQQCEEVPAPDIPVPVTPPASDALPLPIALLHPSGQPRLGSARQLAYSATTPANVKQEQVSGAQAAQLGHINSTATATNPAVPSLGMPAAVVSRLPVQQCSPEDLLLAVLTGAPRGVPLGHSRLAPPAARLGTPGSFAAAAAMPLRKQPVLDAASWHDAGAGWGVSTRWGTGEDAPAGEEDATVCVMCWEKPRQTTLAPCGHTALCAPCTKLLLAQRAPPLCPICRCGVQSYIMREFNA